MVYFLNSSLVALLKIEELRTGPLWSPESAGRAEVEPAKGPKGKKESESEVAQSCLTL